MLLRMTLIRWWGLKLVDTNDLRLYRWSLQWQAGMCRTGHCACGYQLLILIMRFASRAYSDAISQVAAGIASPR